MPVSVTENASTASAALSASLSLLQPARATRTSSETVPRCVNLNAFESRVLEDLLHALRIGLHVERQIGRDVNQEVDALGLGDVAERALQQIVQIGEVYFADIEHDRAGFDLREVENVVDERQQVVAGGMNRLGVFGLPTESGCRPDSSTADRTGSASC